MTKKLKKVMTILSFIGIGLVLLSALRLPLEAFFRFSIDQKISLYITIGGVVMLLATTIMSIWLVEGKYNKICQIVLSTGVLSYLLYKVLAFTSINISDILIIVSSSLFIVAGLMLIIGLCVPKLRAKAKSLYFLGIETFVFGFTTLLASTVLRGGLLADSAGLMEYMRVSILLISMVYFSLEVNNYESKKPLFWFATLLFISASIPLAISFASWL